MLATHQSAADHDSVLQENLRRLAARLRAEQADAFGLICVDQVVGARRVRTGPSATAREGASSGPPTLSDN
jgi:hypothetical protein